MTVLTMSVESTRNQRCSRVLAPPGKFWKFKYSRMQSRAIWTLKLPVIWCWKTLISNVCHVQCSCSSCSVSIFFCDILVWIYWSWAFFKWQRPSAHSQHLWQVQQQVLNLYMLNYLNLHLEWHKMLLNMVINIQQNIADWFLIKQIFLL